MRKFLFFFIFGIFVFFIIPSPNVAQQLECDECGYCIGREAPGSWESCRACIYEGSNEDPASNETLRVTKTPGRYYTQLGCLNTEAESFTDPTAQGGLLNFLLSRLLFPIVGTLSFISLIYGAFLLMTAQGSSEQVGRGKSYIVGAIVGLIFTLSAVLIINIIAGDILRIPGFSRTPSISVIAGARRNGVDRDLIGEVEMGVFVNGTMVEQFTIKGVDRMPNEEDFQTFTVEYPGLDITKDTVGVGYLNDYCRRWGTCGGGPSDPSANRDLVVKTIGINGRSCINFDRPWNWQGNSLVFFSNGQATCIDWN